MSDNETTKAKSGWTDKERLTYLFALIDNANVKFDYNNTPRPTGRSVIACQRMMERMKGTLKNELEALKTGKPIEEGKTEGTLKKAGTTPRKRKTKGDGEGEGEVQGTPTKRGRKKKVDVEAEAEAEAEIEVEERKVKAEPKDEEEVDDGEGDV